MTKGKYYNYIIAELDTTNGYQYEYVKNVINCKGGVEIIPVVKCPKSMKLVCILNYRYPLKSYVLEFPGGCVDKGESLKEAAKRELKEETGIDCDDFYNYPRTCFVDPWKSDDQNNIFYAIINAKDNCQQNLCKEQNLDEIENIKVVFFDLNQIEKQIDELVKKLNCKISISLAYFLTFRKLFENLNNQSFLIKFEF